MSGRTVSFGFLTLCLAFLATLAQAVKFDLAPSSKPPSPADPHLVSCFPNIDCIWNFAPGDTLVIVSANIPPVDGIRVDIDIVDGSQAKNVYLSKKDIKGESRLAITTHQSADVGVCVKAVQTGQSSQRTRSIDLDIDIGADAYDYNALANQESLSVLEVEMRKLENVVKEIQEEMQYLQNREMRMRDTNESTNDRVKWFSIMITLGIVALGAWQLMHLRSFFKRKYLID